MSNKKFMNILHKGILALVVFIVLPVILFVLITSRTSLILGIRSFDVLTGSMEPAVHVGSMIFTAPQFSYKSGDIITFKRGDITITHRIVGMEKNQYLTKGDANKSEDPQHVLTSDVIGRNVLTIPYFGKLTSFIKTIPGFFFLVVLPTLLFIGFEARTIKEEWEKEIEKKLLKRLQPAETL